MPRFGKLAIGGTLEALCGAVLCSEAETDKDASHSQEDSKAPTEIF